MVETSDTGQKEDWRKRGHGLSLSGEEHEPAGELAALQNALRRAAAAAHRLEAQRARDDTRSAWAMNWRARTRHLIELGGLVVKAGLVELTSDDRALLKGVPGDR